VFVRPWHFLVTAVFAAGVLLATASPVRALTPEEADALLQMAFKQVLERDHTPGPSAYRDQLLAGRPLRHIMREMGHSEEYRLKFINHQTPDQAVRLMFRHFLGRDPVPEPNRTVEQVVADKVDRYTRLGWHAVVDEFMNCAEARAKYGDDPPPPRSEPRRQNDK
jgi:hypothetical protein